MLNIAICDDQQSDINDITEKITTFIENTKVQIQLRAYQQVDRLLDECTDFDAIYLDIFIGEVNGFDVMEKIMLRNAEVKIIIISSYSEYQSNALHCHSFDYLTKPIKYEDIERTLKDIVCLNALRDMNKLSFEHMNRNGMLQTKYDDIYYFEYSNKCVILKTTKNDYVMRSSIKDIKQVLNMDYFIVPHRAFIVNPKNIAFIKKLIIKMNNGDEIPISQLERSRVSKAFKKYTLK